MTVEKPKPITTGANSAMNQSQFLAITCNSLKAQEKSRVHGAIGLGFASHWLKNWRESFKPITKRSNRNHVITFDSNLKTALFVLYHLFVRSPITDHGPCLERRRVFRLPQRLSIFFNSKIIFSFMVIIFNKRQRTCSPPRVKIRKYNVSGALKNNILCLQTIKLLQTKLACIAGERELSTPIEYCSRHIGLERSRNMEPIRE